MRHRLVASGLGVLLVAAPMMVGAQAFGPAHHVIAFHGRATGGTNARPAFNRRLLGIINNSANVVFCSVDGVDAAADEGIRLAATGTTGDRIVFDRQVPQGPVRCMSETNGSRVLIIEGR